MEEHCWMCTSFEADPMRHDRGSCQYATDALKDELGITLAAPLMVKARSGTCNGFEMSKDAMRLTAEWAAEAAFMRANKYSVEPESVRA